MQILKVPCLLLFLIVLQNNLSGQDKLNIKFGKVIPEDFNIESVLIDSSTHAVVVADIGKSIFVANTNDLTSSLVFTGKKRDGLHLGNAGLNKYSFTHKRTFIQDHLQGIHIIRGCRYGSP